LDDEVYEILSGLNKRLKNLENQMENLKERSNDGIRSIYHSLNVQNNLDVNQTRKQEIDPKSVADLVILHYRKNPPRKRR